MTILVTGGAGYIGSHAVRALQRQGLAVVVLDNLVYGHREIVEQVLQIPLVVGQLGDRALLDRLLSGNHPATGGTQIEAVLHFAAYAYVGESVAEPALYYRNNLGDSLILLEAGGGGVGPPPPLQRSATAGVLQHLRHLRNSGPPAHPHPRKLSSEADQSIWPQQVDGRAAARRLRCRLRLAECNISLFQCCWRRPGRWSRGRSHPRNPPDPAAARRNGWTQPLLADLWRRLSNPRWHLHPRLRACERPC